MSLRPATGTGQAALARGLGRSLHARVHDPPIRRILSLPRNESRPQPTKHSKTPRSRNRMRRRPGRDLRRREVQAGCGPKARRSQVRAQQCVLLAGRLDCRGGGFASHGPSLSLRRYVECGRRAPSSPGFRADTEEESRESLLAAPMCWTPRK